MSKQTFTSNAEWPEGTIPGHNVTSDAHMNREMAQGVCNHLERRGFGGDGKVFPVRTWVAPIATNTEGAE